MPATGGRGRGWSESGALDMIAFVLDYSRSLSAVRSSFLVAPPENIVRSPTHEEIVGCPSACRDGVCHWLQAGKQRQYRYGRRRYGRFVDRRQRYGNEHHRNDCDDE